MNASVSILLLDDDAMLRRATALLLENRGGAVEAAATPDEAVALAAARLYDVAVFDVARAAQVTALLRRIRKGGLVPRRVITVCDDEADAPEDGEVVAVLRKPYAFDRLLAAVFGARSRARTRSGVFTRPGRATRPRLTPRAPRRAGRALRDRG